MISEPELVGGAAFPAGDPPRRTPEAGATVGGVPAGGAAALRTPEPGAPGTRRRWPWALGGALLASAVWAGGLYAYDRSQEDGPDLGGYRAVGNLCEKAELKALSAELGKRSVDPASNAPTARHPALDKARCTVMLGSADTGYSVDVQYDLHKATDPGPEFEPGLGDLAKHAEAVEGLGERAFVQNQPEEFAGAWIAVLDGQAELNIWLSPQQTWDLEKDEAVPSTPKTDLSGVEALLVQDMKALMAALKE
ncbi:hypothetical protein [Streptomyces sp. NPDC053755]|uniref:hypothetical protein n=1 Tax=Streptomyces sp. NPDC053755 TaxID=3155815 RepID=UPI00344953FB